MLHYRDASGTHSKDFFDGYNEHKLVQCKNFFYVSILNLKDLNTLYSQRI